MKFGITPLKIIHWDGIEKLRGIREVFPDLIVNRKQPIIKDEKVLFYIRWEYRIYSVTQEQLFSYISEHYLQFDFEKGDSINDIKHLIQDAHLNVDAHYQEKTVNTILSGTTIPIDDSIIDPLANEVWEVARQAGLL